MEQLLPAKPSDILSVALKDFRAIKRHSGYAIDMNQWHTPNDVNDICYVCLAGSVMANSLAVFNQETLTCSDFEASNEQKLRFLDGIREGLLSHYGHQFSLSISQEMANQLTVAIEDLYQRHNSRGLGELGHNETGDAFEDYLEEATRLLKRFGA